jgi:hypothetical protein
MGSRAQRLYTCRVGMRSARRCTHPKAGKATLFCEFGHVVTIWMCKRHLKMVESQYLVCKMCYKMGRENIKCRKMPLVADLPLRFRTLDAQFDSE